MAERPTLNGRPRWWAVAVLAVSIIALAGLTALGAREVPGSGTSRQLVTDLGWDPRLIFIWIVATLFGLAAYTALTSRRGRIQRGGRGGRRSNPIAVFLVLAVVAIVVLLPRSGDTGGERVPPALPGEGNLIETPPAQVVGTPWGLVIVALVIALVVLAFFAIGRRAASEVYSPVEIAGLSASVEAAIQELELGGDPSRVVIAAYRNMEAAFARSGLGRVRHEAPHEYVARALGLLEVDGASITRLTQLFEEARFSTHAIDESMATEAVAALQSIRHELELA